MEAINLDLNIDLSEQEINFEVLNCHLDDMFDGQTTGGKSRLPLSKRNTQQRPHFKRVDFRLTSTTI